MPPNTETGRRGEFLAAYILESHGIECHHVNREGADLWCKIQGRVFTVEVKSASMKAKPDRGRPSSYYQFHTNKKNAEFYCLVALDRQLLVVRHATLITGGTTRVSVSEFNEANQRRTIEEMINP